MQSKSSHSGKYLVKIVIGLVLLASLLAALTPNTRKPPNVTNETQVPVPSPAEESSPSPQPFPTGSLVPVAPAAPSTYSSPTSCNPTTIGGMDCTTSDSSGVQTKHCIDNHLGGYDCL